MRGLSRAAVGQCNRKDPGVGVGDGPQLKCNSDLLLPVQRAIQEGVFANVALDIQAGCDELAHPGPSEWASRGIRLTLGNVRDARTPVLHPHPLALTLQALRYCAPETHLLVESSD